MYLDDLGVGGLGDGGLLGGLDHTDGIGAGVGDGRRREADEGRAQQALVQLIVLRQQLVQGVVLQTWQASVLYHNRESLCFNPSIGYPTSSILAWDWLYALY